MVLQKSLLSKYCLTIVSINVKESDHEELLGITIGKHLDFKKHIENLCWNANYKLHALRHMRKKLAVEKAKLLGNAFIDSQFNSAPLIWMFCQKTLYLKIEKIHYKMLSIIDQPNASYLDLLECNGSTSFHQQHLQLLLTEIYKSTVTTNPILMQHFFREKKAPYNLKTVQCFSFYLQGRQLMRKTLHIFVAH